MKGEITVVISEETKKINETIDKTKITNMAKKYLKKYSLKDTVKFIIKNKNLSKKEVYKLCLKIKNEKNN